MIFVGFYFYCLFCPHSFYPKKVLFLMLNQRKPLKILSYNVHRGLSHRKKMVKDLMVQHLRKIDIGIFCFQEIWFSAQEEQSGFESVVGSKGYWICEELV